MSCRRCHTTPCGCKTKTVIIDPCPVGYNEVMTDPLATAQAVSDCDGTDFSNDLFLTNYVTFNMPACGETADVVFHDAERVAPGSVAFALGVGYLSVEAVVDSITLRLKNHCGTCGGDALNGKEPGQAVAAATMFIFGIPFCSFGSGSSIVGGGPYLDADFTIPVSGSCALAKATTVQGLSIGDIVSVDSKEYRIGGIPDGTTLQLCNDGDGGTANTTIYHDINNDGAPDFPILRLQGQNPCTTTAVTTAARLVGCNGPGQEVGIIGEVAAQVPSWDGSAWALRVLPKERACAKLVTELTLDPGAPDDQTYIVEVDNIDPILELLPPEASNDLLYLELDEQLMRLDSVITGNTIRLQSAHEVAAIETYAVGSVLCAVEYGNQCHTNVSVNGPFNGTRDPKEFSVVIADTGNIPFALVIPANTTTVTVIPTTNLSTGTGVGGNELGLWQLTYDEGPFGCDKYIAVRTNFEATIVMPDGGVAANVEFRIVKILPSFDTQVGASDTFYGGFPLISPAIPPNLLIGGNGGAFYGINTFKGNLDERDYYVKGQLCKWQGHVRIVAQNTTGAPKTISFAGLWRGRREAHSYIVL